MIQKNSDFLKAFDELAMIEHAKQMPRNFFWLEKDKGAVPVKKEDIGKPVTVTLKNEPPKWPILKGDKVKLGNKSKRFINHIPGAKNKFAVARMMKRKFNPLFVVTHSSDYGLNCTMKPYNF